MCECVGWAQIRWIHFGLNQITNTTHNHNHNHTGGLELTSPKTGLTIEPALALLAPNVMARSQVLEYREAKTREWKAAERQWREWAEAQEK